MLMQRSINLEPLMRTISFSFIFASSLFACATDTEQSVPGDDELGGEVGDGEQAKADGIDTFGIYTAVKVGAFECNGQGSCTHVELARPNRSTTTCADSTVAESCEVRYLDFSKLNLSTTKLNAATKKLQASAADPSIGAQLLVRGKYIHGTNPLAPGVDWVTFEVSELWTAQLGNGSLDGTFVMLTDNGRRCIDAPCGSITETRVNSSRAMDIDGLDWSEEAQPGALRDKIFAAESQADGAIIVGYRTHGKLMHLPTTMRTIDQAFLRVK